MTQGPLLRICLRASFSHPFRTCLLILGIALGVAGVIAIDIAKTSVGKSFELSIASLTSRATHQITGAGFEVPQDLFRKIRTELGIHRSAPVISKEVKVVQFENRTFTLLGVDPFSEAPFRQFAFGPGSNGPDLSGLLTREGGILISRSLAQTHGIGPGQILSLVFW